MSRTAKETFAERPEFEAPRAPNRMLQDWHQCRNVTCQRWYAAPRKETNRGRWIYCSIKCSAEAATAEGKFKGEKNPSWLGGVSNDNMRYRRRQIERHPVEEAARRAVRAAVESGRLVRQPCEKCGAEIAQAHHDDYSKPLDVRWLCRLHHDEHHREERLAKRRERVARVNSKRPDAPRVTIEMPDGSQATDLASALGELAADLYLDGVDLSKTEDR